MRLIELRANKRSFNTVKFNPKGISLIVAVQETKEEKDTYNSVGKSLIITLVHFCLASRSNTEFEEKLKDWVFSLDFEIGDEKFTSSRSTSKQDEITLNEKNLTLSDFKKEIGDKVFFFKREGLKFISFRGLISRFIRPKKSSYVSYNEYIKEEQQIQQLINNSFLLGLDITRILMKHKLKDEYDKILKHMKNIEKDPIMKSFFKGDIDEDIEIRIVELESKIVPLRKNLKNFKIAEDYDVIRKEADALSLQLKSVKNKASRLKNVIGNIERSLDIQPDISRAEIIKLYEEARVSLHGMVVKRLEELENFNNKLLGNRTQKLLEEKGHFENELKNIERTIKEIGAQEDEKLQYLNTHGVLDEYTQLSNQLKDTEVKLERLQRYKQLMSEYKNKFEDTKKEFIGENISTSKYLEEAEPIIKNNILLFKSFAEKFYKHKSSGITISSNDGINKKRFEIKAKIQDDAGDAVNEVKIFCFDWTILKAQYNHNVKFLFHDSRITDGMDTRQQVTMFRIAHEECKKGDFQYIISANQNLIESLKDKMTDEDYRTCISDNVVLELSDKSDENKLLGIQVDLDYEEEQGKREEEEIAQEVEV